MNEIPRPSSASGLPPATSIAAWRVLLRGAGAFLGLFVFCFWAAKGYHRGWTQNEVPVPQIDPITEIAYVTYERRFVPGLDVLGGGLLLGVLVFAVTFLPTRSPTVSRS
jgi:hypothetical protein